jgi:hypothetical protein
MGVREGGVRDRVPMGVYCVINAGLIEQRAVLCEVLWSAEGGATGACECFRGVRRVKLLGVRSRECVVHGKL